MGKIDNPNKSLAKKKKVKTSIDKPQRAILDLVAKARQHESVWPKETKPETNGNKQESSSGTDASTDEDQGNEDALLGDVKRRKRRKRLSDDENHKKIQSSDEYS